ncbi:hypothetical protein [Psychrobacter sp. NPDC078501]|uniref:hypothetical protein n=1 Tax=Psychrobacter sp. NPDC078501 TaxID=3364495 RepID=UPI00384E07CB
MYEVYEDESIPLQIRRLMVFDEIIHLPCYSQIAFSIVYSKKDRKYTAFGSVFKYAHTRQEVIEQGLDKQFHEDTVMCAITIER